MPLFTRGRSAQRLAKEVAPFEVRALHTLTQAAALGEGRTLYEANREDYGL